MVAGLKQGASRSPQDAGRSSLVISLRACAPGWEMAGPSLSQVRGEGGGRARRACSRGSWMGDGRARPESGPWRGWRPGTEVTQQRLLDGRWQAQPVRSVERVEAGHGGHTAKQGS